MDALALSYGKRPFKSNIILTALIDTCARKNVIRKQILEKLRQNRYIEILLQNENKTHSTVKMASGQLVSVDTQASLPFKFGNQYILRKTWCLNRPTLRSLVNFLHKTPHLTLP